MLKLPYLNAIRDKDINTYETLVALRNAIISLSQTTGGAALGVRQTPTNAGSIVVTENSGNYHVRITDPSASYGEEYFIQYATKPDFSDAVTIDNGASRDLDTYMNISVSTYWRFQKQLSGSNPSPWVNFGSPTAVAGSGTGTAPPSGGGSGTGGGGYGVPGKTKVSLL